MFKLKNIFYTCYQSWIIDHALLRLFWPNFVCISTEKQVYRSGQPSLWTLYAFKRRGGKIVLNLRGGQSKAWNCLERVYCDHLGLTYVNIALNSSRPPEKKRIIELIKFFEENDEHLLIHCKTGADRTGLVSGIFLMSVLNIDAKTAQNQLSYRFLHFGLGKKAILRKFFSYINDSKKQGQSLLHWAQEDYDPHFASLVNVKYSNCHERS